MGDSLLIHVLLALNSYFKYRWLPRWLSGKEPTYQSRKCRRQRFDFWFRKIPQRRFPLQYSCLGNPMDRAAWQAVVHGVTRSWTWLSNWACMPTSNTTFSMNISSSIFPPKEALALSSKPLYLYLYWFIYISFMALGTLYFRLLLFAGMLSLCYWNVLPSQPM